MLYVLNIFLQFRHSVLLTGTFAYSSKCFDADLGFVLFGLGEADLRFGLGDLCFGFEAGFLFGLGFEAGLRFGLGFEADLCFGFEADLRFGLGFEADLCFGFEADLRFGLGFEAALLFGLGDLCFEAGFLFGLGFEADLRRALLFVLCPLLCVFLEPLFFACLFGFLQPLDFIHAQGDEHDAFLFREQADIYYERAKKIKINNLNHKTNVSFDVKLRHR